MGADLSSNTLFGRVSLVLLEDCLIKLEHGRTKDRVRKFLFGSIESVTIWRKLPSVRIIVCTVFFVAPGVFILFIGNTAATVCGSLLILLGAGLIFWYVYCRTTTIRIVRGGRPSDLTGIFRPGRMRRFTERLIASINRAQEVAGASPQLPPTSQPQPPV